MSDELENVWAVHETQVGPAELNHACNAAGPDQVVCRECAGTFGQITEQHLQIHDMTLNEYKTAYPDAPIYPDDSDRLPGREPGFTHPEETKQKIAESARRNHDRGVYE